MVLDRMRCRNLLKQKTFGAGESGEQGTTWHYQMYAECIVQVHVHPRGTCFILASLTSASLFVALDVAELLSNDDEVGVGVTLWSNITYLPYCNRLSTIVHPHYVLFCPVSTMQRTNM